MLPQIVDDGQSVGSGEVGQSPRAQAVDRSSGAWSGRLPGRSGAWALGGLFLLAGLFFFDVVRGETFFRIDFHQTFEPLRATLGEALREGLPVWDRRLNNGTPLLANPMHAAMYPPNLLFAWFPAATLLSVLTVAHVMLGACGTLLLCRAWGTRPSAAFAAAVTCGLGGATLSAIPYTNLCWSQAWMPWLVLAWTRTVEPVGRHRAPAAAALALVAACMLSLAEPVILLASGLGIALLTVERLYASRAAGLSRQAGSVVGVPLAALALAALLVSPFLTAVVAYGPECERASGFDSAVMTTWSMHPLLGLGVLVPGVYGDALREGNGAFWAKNLEPTGHLLFSSLYVGGLVVGLAAIGAVARRRRSWPLVAWLVVLVLLALGRWGPIYSLLVSLPVMDLVRYPIKWGLAGMLPLSLLVGFGLESTAAAGSRGARTLLIVVLALSAVPAFVSISALPGQSSWLLSLSDEVGPTGNGPPEELRRWILDHVLRAAARGALPLLAATLLLLGARRKQILLAAGLPAIIVVDLLTANAGVAQTVPSHFFELTPPAIEAISRDSADVERVYLEAPMVARLSKVPPAEWRVDLAAWERATATGYVGASYGLDLAFNVDVGQFRSLQYAKLHSMVLTAPMRPKLMLLGAAGVTHLVTYGNYRSEHLELIAVIPVGADRPQEVARNHLAVPRARVVPTLLPYDGDQGFMLTVDAAADDLFRRAALVDRSELNRVGIREDDLLPVRFDGRPPGSGQVVVVEDLGAVVRLRVAGSGGYLVVNDTWTAAWRASVDGEDVPLLRADYAFRAVAVPRGSHEVVLRCGLW